MRNQALADTWSREDEEDEDEVGRWRSERRNACVNTCMWNWVGFLKAFIVYRYDLCAVYRQLNIENKFSDS